MNFFWSLMFTFYLFEMSFASLSEKRTQNLTKTAKNRIKLFKKIKLNAINMLQKIGIFIRKKRIQLSKDEKKHFTAVSKTFKKLTEFKIEDKTLTDKYLSKCIPVFMKTKSVINMIVKKMITQKNELNHKIAEENKKINDFNEEENKSHKERIDYLIKIANSSHETFDNDIKSLELLKSEIANEISIYQNQRKIFESTLNQLKEVQCNIREFQCLNDAISYLETVKENNPNDNPEIMHSKKRVDVEKSVKKFRLDLKRCENFIKDAQKIIRNLEIGIQKLKNSLKIEKN
ncbi:hypothetical protein EDEG_00821 [Edhazardia aedis USNM 41457]|uniref:Uncharacterized protein n=1 Tax=Edhazardia aedis (strain USNM 41457) TaxID=1003232 RepID=J9DR36_EDHAE|nr:hypothetical protein EDEG_00821 [Edhazardia aedis USNM 41457]|eukprot:EJW05040.1 hypothetical protein EDEG_00821 [Edhazardia aedis USNM 41457]